MFNPRIPLHETILKVNCPSILLRNLNPHEGVGNGTRMTVTAMAERVIEAQLLAVIHAGRRAFISRILLDSLMLTGLGLILYRLQVLIRLGFGMSIDKAQG